MSPSRMKRYSCSNYELQQCNDLRQKSKIIAYVSINICTGVQEMIVCRVPSWTKRESWSRKGQNPSHLFHHHQHLSSVVFYPCSPKPQQTHVVMHQTLMTIWTFLLLWEVAPNRMDLTTFITQVLIKRQYFFQIK